MGKVSKDDKIKLLEAKVSLLEAEVLLKDGMEEVRVSALAYMLRYDKRALCVVVGSYQRLSTNSFV